MTNPGRRLRRALERQKRTAPTLVAYDMGSFPSAQDAVLAAARAQGCTCRPDITLDGAGHAHALHDDWCALLRRGDVN